QVGAGSTHTAIASGSNTVNLTGPAAGPHGGPVQLRLVATGATNTSGTWRLDDVTVTGSVGPAAQVAPAITSAPPAGAVVGQPYTYTIAATGTPAPTITVTG